ncbi:hypothetical protein SCACP_40240 [Sporomusa carbonis]
MAKKQERCKQGGCKDSGKSSLEFGKEICPQSKEERKEDKGCK